MSDDLPLPTTISVDPEDWARTPKSVQTAFLMLEDRVKRLEAEVAGLRAQVAELLDPLRKLLALARYWDDVGLVRNRSRVLVSPSISIFQ